MHDPADNPKTGAYYIHHPPVKLSRPWLRIALTIGLMFLLGAGLVLASLRSDPIELRTARRHVDGMDPEALRRGAESVDQQLATLFDPRDPAGAAMYDTNGQTVAVKPIVSEPAAPDASPSKPHGHTIAGSSRGKRGSNMTLGPSEASAAVVDGSVSHGGLAGAGGSAIPSANATASVTRELEEMKPADGVRTLRLTLAQANAWLRMNLADWARAHDYELPSQVTRPVVSVDGDRLVMGFRFSGRYYTQSFSVAFTTQFAANGKARLRVENVRAGSLPLPMGAVASTLDGMSQGGHEARQAGHWIDRMQNMEFSPTLRLASGRRLRVVGYRPDGDGIELSLRAEASKAQAR